MTIGPLEPNDPRSAVRSQQEFKYVIVKDDWEGDSLRDVKTLLAEGWEPFRETPMPSSGANRHQPATCLVVMTRNKEVSNGTR